MPRRLLRRAPPGSPGRCEWPGLALPARTGPWIALAEQARGPCVGLGRGRRSRSSWRRDALEPERGESFRARWSPRWWSWLWSRAGPDECGTCRCRDRARRDRRPLLDVYRDLPPGDRTDPELVKHAARPIVIAALVVGVVWGVIQTVLRAIAEVGPRTRSVALRLEGLLAGLAVVAALAGAVIATGDPVQKVSDQYDDFVNLRTGGQATRASCPAAATATTTGGSRGRSSRASPCAGWEPEIIPATTSWSAGPARTSASRTACRCKPSRSWGSWAGYCLQRSLQRWSQGSGARAGVRGARRPGEWSPSRRAAHSSPGSCTRASLAAQHSGRHWSGAVRRRGAPRPLVTQRAKQGVTTVRAFAVAGAAVAVIVAADVTGRIAYADHLGIQGRNELLLRPDRGASQARTERLH